MRLVIARARAVFLRLGCARAGAPNEFGRRRTNEAPPTIAHLFEEGAQLDAMDADPDAAAPPPLAARPRDPRRLAAILLLALTGGLILAFLYARGELAGSDALAYWMSIRVWLNGGDPFVAPEPFLPWSYAPWTLYLFLPWALLPWSVAWFFWRAINIALFAWTVGWAYRRRPLTTALIVAALGVPLAANLDTGNINMLIVLAMWAAQFTGPRLGGLLWALGAALKWVPAVLIVFLPRPAWRWGLLFLALAAILTLATWPQTLSQIDIAFNFPRPVRVDYLLLLWAGVPWLWRKLDRQRRLDPDAAQP